MPTLPKLGDTQKLYLPSTDGLPEEQRAWVVLQGGKALGGDMANVSDPKNKGLVSLEILTGRIKEWNYTEPDGKVTPINIDNVKRLELDDLSYLFDQLDLEQTEQLSPEEKKSSSPTLEQPQTA